MRIQHLVIVVVVLESFLPTRSVECALSSVGQHKSTFYNYLPPAAVPQHDAATEICISLFYNLE